MSLIIAWSKKWQVTFAPVKTQAIGILGVQIVRRLIFTDHVRRMAKNAAKLTCIRRIAPLLDAKDLPLPGSLHYGFLSLYVVLLPYHTWDY